MEERRKVQLVFTANNLTVVRNTVTITCIGTWSNSLLLVQTVHNKKSCTMLHKSYEGSTELCTREDIHKEFSHTGIPNYINTVLRGWDGMRGMRGMMNTFSCSEEVCM